MCWLWEEPGAPSAGRAALCLHQNVPDHTNTSLQHLRAAGREDRWKAVGDPTQNNLTAPRPLQVQPLSHPQHPQDTSPVNLNPPVVRNRQENAQQSQRARKSQCWGLRGVLCLRQEQKGPDYCHHSASRGLPAINSHHNHLGCAFFGGWAAPRGRSRAGRGLMGLGPPSVQQQHSLATPSNLLVND